MAVISDHQDIHNCIEAVGLEKRYFLSYKAELLTEAHSTNLGRMGIRVEKTFSSKVFQSQQAKTELEQSPHWDHPGSNFKF